MRLEFSAKTKLAAWNRADGICECGCGQPFGKHPKECPEYNHKVAAALGGDNSLENCECIRKDCHDAITYGEQKRQITKAIRGEKKRRNIKPAFKQKIPGSIGTRLKKKMDGTVVPR